MLSEHSEEYTEVAAFPYGADDFVLKPVRMRALAKRIEVHITRKERRFDSLSIIRIDKNLTIDPRKYSVYLSGKKLLIPKKEFELLYLLSQHPSRTLTRSELLEKVWGDKVNVGTRTIDVHIRKIRSKIGYKYIKTVKGKGYQLNVSQR